jgi:DNA repair exonuclease SbcCD ATPase subunit
MASRGKVPAMAKTRQDILTRLADAGEEAFSRVAGSQTTARVLEAMTGMRERIEELQRRVTGLDELEERVAKLEKTVAELNKPKTRARSTTRSPARRSTTSRPATRKKPPPS